MFSTSAAEKVGRSRAVAWTIAGGALVALLILIACLAAWFLGPTMAPMYVARFSPWITPVMRAAATAEAGNPLGGALGNPGGAALVLGEWTRRRPERYIALSSYLDSPSPVDRYLAAAAFADIDDADVLPEVDRALFRMLRHDPISNLRQLAAAGVTDVHKIPELEALARDPDQFVAAQVERTLQILHLKAGMTAP
ncbi:MAG: hypothetical protein H0X38_04480 [Planctomycetes bacterium]|nr:hypothetical protein [Planctomycetota bacterium]